MENVKNEATISIPFEKVSSIYYKYQDNTRNKYNEYEKKLRADFENNFIGLPKELLMTEMEINDKIERFYLKVRDTYCFNAGNEMYVLVRTVFNVIYTKAIADGHTYGSKKIIHKLNDLINFQFKFEKAKMR